MYYTVIEVAKKTNISPHTLRFYSKEGLFPFVERSEGGIRMFKDEDFGWIALINCLKKGGMSLKDIRRFINLAMEGDSTISQRLEMFQNQRRAVEQQIDELKDVLGLLEYKCWFYEEAEKAGSTAVPRSMKMEDLPQEIKPLRRTSDRMHTFE